MAERENRNQSSPTKSDKEELNTANLLEDLEKQESLYELHAHLLGMGNASFWIHGILTDRAKLPTQQDFVKSNATRSHLGPLVWDKVNRKFIGSRITKKFFDKKRDCTNTQSLQESNIPIALRNLIPNTFDQELNRRDLTFKKDFSYDIILLLDDLAKGLGLKENQERDMIQAMVEEKLGIHTRNDWEKPFFKNWIIFNARRQELQIVYGIQAEDLRMLIGGAKPIQDLTNPAQRDARSHIINAFSMMNADGSEPRSADFHSFRGAFTPEFFPRRFALKDSIYSQRLDLLAFLLKNALHRFSTCLPPVKYCEFSVGCGDLTRPWVFDVLSAFAENSGFSGKFKKLISDKRFPWLKTDGFKLNIDYRFLAGFNRRILRISDAYTPDEAVMLLFEIPHHAIHLMLTEFYKADNERPTILFTEQVEQLHRMKEEVKSNPHFFHWVVGLDLFGDELGYPYCPFIAYEFLQFVQAGREENSNFGVRIHCAENVPFIRPDLSGYCLFAAHMYIVYRCLDFLKMKLGSNIRIGHGIAFDKILSIKNFKSRKSSVLVAEMQQNARSVLSSIPFEVNITSNYYLLGDAIRNVEKIKPLSTLYEINVPVMLSTDDDGIWPIDRCSLGHQSHHSLAAEYCRAITTRFITSKDQLEKMVKNAKDFCFKNGKESTKVNNSRTQENQDSSKASYYPIDIIVHPNVFHILLDKDVKSPEKDSCHCLKYYTSIYRSEQACIGRNFKDDNWRINCERIAPVVVACFYLTRSLAYEKYEKEYKILFTHHSLCAKTYNLCKNVYTQLMYDTPGQGVSMKVRVNGADHFFYSEGLDYRKGPSDYLFQTIRKIIANASETKTEISCFLLSIDPEKKKDFESIDEKIRGKDIIIQVYTNRETNGDFLKSESGNLHIGSKPKENVDPSGKVECGLYTVCSHGSVAAAALDFISRRITCDIVIDEKHTPFSTLIIPFFPLRFGYPAISHEENENELKKRFLKVYHIKNSNIVEKISVQNSSMCRNLCDAKYNLLLSDVRYAKKIHISDLIEKIYSPEDQFLKILKILQRSIKEFNLWPTTFVLLENVNKYKSYEKLCKNRIPLPIISFKNKYLICSCVDFVETKFEAHGWLWSLAVNNNSLSVNRNNPYEYPFKKWVNAIVKISSKTLNKQFREDTWEHFVESALLDASERIWHWFTINSWCDMITAAFDSEENLNSFVKFLKRKKEFAEKFTVLLEDSSRYKIGNRWQKDIIDNHKAREHLDKIYELLSKKKTNKRKKTNMGKKTNKRRKKNSLGPGGS